jgi:uncharacterized protein YifE (UPF0438 family)
MTVNKELHDVELVCFPLRPLRHFSQILFTEEIEFLAEWGDHAANLTTGTVSPVSAKELQFVKVIKGEAPPETRYQHLWLRYLQAMNACAKLNTYEQKVNDLEASLAEAKAAIAKLESDGQQLTAEHKNEHDGLDMPVSSQSANSAFRQSPVDCASEWPEMKKMEAQPIKNALTNSGRYSPLLEQLERYAAMSNDAIFTLCDSGIRQRLTGADLDVFNSEYQKRRDSERQKSRGLYVERGTGCEACGRPISFCSCGG